MIRPYDSCQYEVISSDIYNKAYEYAYKVTLTKEGIYDEQNNFDYKVQQALYGKIGEQASYNVLRKYDAKTIPPDYKVHEKPNWESDLKNFCGYDIAVKTQTTDSMRLNKLGWMFQNQPGVRVDPILRKQSSLVCFVLSGKLTNNHEVKCIVFPLLSIKDLVWRETRKENLKGKKVVADGTKLYGLLGINESYLSFFEDVLDK